MVITVLPMKKRLLLDMSMLKYYYTGLGQFSYFLGQSLLALSPPSYEYHILKYPDTKDYFPHSDIHTHTMSVWRRIAAKRQLPFLWQSFDLWHIFSQNSHYFPFHTQNPVLFTVHDIHFLFMENGKQREFMKNLMQKKLDHATHITAISRRVKDDIESHFTLRGKTIDVIYNGVDYAQFPDASAPVYCDSGMPFLLTLGTVTRRKNIHVLLEMMVHLPAYRLLIGGTIADKEYYQEMKQAMEHYGLNERVVFTGTMSDEEKYYCYTHCAAVVFPSLMEGFGMPVIEAFLAGKPVFCSALTSLPEIGGDLAYYWHTFAPESMALAVQEGLRQSREQPTLSAQRKQYAERFSWSTSAAEYLQLYEELISSRKNMI